MELQYALALIEKLEAEIATLKLRVQNIEQKPPVQIHNHYTYPQYVPQYLPYYWQQQFYYSQPYAVGNTNALNPQQLQSGPNY